MSTSSSLVTVTDRVSGSSTAPPPPPLAGLRSSLVRGRSPVTATAAAAPEVGRGGRKEGSCEPDGVQTATDTAKRRRQSQ